MGYEYWAADVTHADDLGLCFVPVEFNMNGDDIESIVWGMNYVSDRCPGKLVAVIHEDGQAAVDAWMAKPENEARLRAATEGGIDAA